jgi:D-alanyl-D-alanine carboxypeptidase
MKEFTVRIANPRRIINQDTGELEPLPGDRPEPVGQLPPVTADAAIVIERWSGRVLGSKSPDLRRAPASTTKIMTALLAVEAVRRGEVALNDLVILAADVNEEEGGDLGLLPGDRVSLRDLLHMTLLRSDNDAATAVGTHVAGSRTAFIDRMNTRATQLGMSSTRYVGISGRDPEDWLAGCVGNDFNNSRCAHYTTARDLATLAVVALDDAGFSEIVGTVTWPTTTWRRSGVGSMDVPLTNTNRLLRQGEQEYYAPAYGVKTGTTDRAGSNLVSSARLGHKDVIAVVLGANNNDDPAGDRYSDSKALLQFGLNA